MTTPAKIQYREWFIEPFAFPQRDHSWTASCEIEKYDANGLQIFRDATPVTRMTKEEAIAAACIDAKRRIDSIIADPRAYTPK